MLNEFLLGAVVMACTTIAVFFLQFWRRTRDRLFICFAIAFALFALNWTMVAILTQDGYPAVYLFRLAGFLIICFGVVGKNKRSTVTES